MLRSVLTILAALSFAACEDGPPPAPSMDRPNPAAILLDAPEEGYRLSAADREKVHHAIDADALERLLARIRPEHREEFLRLYQGFAPGTKVFFGPMSSLGDPEVDAIARELVRRPSPPSR
jgi:hypothetical protein